MDLSDRMSGAQHRSLAARWRRLAEDATTPQTRNHLLTLVRQCEYLAGGRRDMVKPADDEQEETGRPDVPR